ncbi:LOW QUALITY PROTEIN: hypothetical protein QYF61_012565 [Mycteria americana]|uniref:ribonuclease H n=1 Tax=Mycteria americana TaxID=33587 RepID=A0AAN7MJ06_MYCAM|nr:LOW QUALITY PROTEIN: hypothetical protein QYF61_012565 [Mycteria americana]
MQTPRSGGGGGAPGTRAEIPLQPVVKTMVKQVVPLQPMEVHSGGDIHLQPVEDPTLEQVDAPEGGCDPMGSLYWSRLLAGPVTLWGTHAGAVCEELQPISKQFKNIIQRSAPRLDSYEWQGVWDSMGKYLSHWAPPVFWNFTPEQVQNPEKLVEYLEKVCHHPANSRETEITAMCWGLAHAYRALFNTIQNPQGSGDKVTGTAAAPITPATGTAAVPITPATGTAAATAPTATGTVAAPALPVTGTATAAAPDNSVTSTAVQPGNEPMSVSVAPIHKKKSWKRKSARLEREDEGARPSQREEDEDEELVNETETTRSLSLSELRDMRKDFSRRPGEHIVTWLLRCWDSGARSLELEGKEAKQLGSLSREGGIDKAIGKGEPARSLWRRLLSAIKERYPFKEDVVYRSGKWTTMEKGIQYLRELAMLEVIYGDLDDVRSPTDPDEVQCTRPMWRKLVRNAPPSCANSLAILIWRDEDGPTVNEVASNLREYEESISSSLVSAVEKLSWKVQRLEEDMSYSPPIRTSVSAIRSQRSSAQGRGYRWYTPRGTLWFYLRDHGEDMRKWDGKPTSTLEARVRELQGKTITKGGSSRKIAALVSSGQFPRQSRRADLTPDFNEGTPDSYIQEVVNEYCDQDKGGPASSQEEERDNRVYWTVWIRWPGTSDPQDYKALVDTGAQCTLMPSSYIGAEPIRISGVTGGSQQLTVLEAEVSLTGNEWQKHPIVTGPEAPCILGIDYLRRGYFKDPKGYRWAFGRAALETEEMKQLSTLPGLSEDPSVVGLLRVKEQQVPIATTTVHRRQYRTNRDSLIPIRELIRRLESQGVISKTHSPFNSPIWPVQKSNGEWRLTVDYRGLNEVTLLLSAAVPDMLELQYELESKAAKWYVTTDIADAFFSIPLEAECRPQFAFTWRGVQYIGIDCPRALEQGEAPEHLQYIDDIIVWGNTAEEVFEKGKKIVQILLKAGFAIKQSKVKGPAQEIQFLGIKWQDGCCQIPMDVINKITAMSPPTSNKETQAFLGVVGFWRMHIPNYSLIVSPLYQGTRKKTDFKWGPEQRQAFEQIKREIVHAVALGPVRAGQDILAAYEGLRAASEVVGTEAQLLLAPRLPVLGWMFKGRVPSTHHATDATWSKWVALITQRARIGNPNRPGILEVIMDWPEGKDFGISPEEEVTRAEEAPRTIKYQKMRSNMPCSLMGPVESIRDGKLLYGVLYNKLQKLLKEKTFLNEKSGQCSISMLTHGWWQMPCGGGYSNGSRTIDSTEANSSGLQHCGKVENLVVKVRHADAHVPKSQATEEHQNNQQVDQAAKIEVAQVDLDWQHKGELFIARWAHDTSGHQGRDATYRWACDRGVDLTMDTIAQVIHECETCAAIKQAKRLKPLWYGGQWMKYQYKEAWQTDYITLPQTRQGKHYVLTMVETTTRWLETYPVPHATDWNTILGLGKQVLW